MRTYMSLIVLIIILGLSACSSEPELVIRPSVGSSIDAEVGGETQPNQVYIDFSRDNQSPVARTKWDLGFYNGSEFAVTLNSPNGMLAYELDKTSLDEVNAEDTIGLGSKLSLDAIFGSLFAPQVPDWVAGSLQWADDPTGNLQNTAIKIKEGSQSIYIVNRGKSGAGDELGWIKIGVSIEGNGYRLEYGEISATSSQVATISKDASQNFNYFSFDAGLVNIEPGIDGWDIAFTTYIDILNFGFDFPYGVKDWVIQNRSVSSAEVIIEANEDLTDRYDSFSLADIASLDFSIAVNAIGGNWRTVASPTPGSVTGVRSDRFYVIKDPDGNYYKLVFTRMVNETGERGFPQVSYSLLQ